MYISIRKFLYVTTAVSMALVIASCGGSASKASGGDETQAGGTGGGRQSQRQARAEATAEKDNKQAAKDAEKLRDLRIKLRGLNIPCDIGTATAATEAEARRIALEEARAAAIANVGFQVQGFAATYAHNVPAVHRTAWEERVKQQATQAVEQADAYKIVTQRDRAAGTFTVTALMILDPVIFKQALHDATFVNNEFQRRAQHDRLMKKMDAVIADFNSKYRRDK